MSNRPASPLDFPIVLENLFFTRSNITAITGFQPSNPQSIKIPENRLEIVPIEGDPDRFLVQMRTTLNLEEDQSTPYRIDMECIAGFRKLAGASDDKAQKALAISGHSITYGAIREAVSWVTGRMPYGTFTLGISILTATEADSQSSI